MPKHAGVDLQPYVDTIHLAAVETLRAEPDPQVISSGKRALETVIEHARTSRRASPVVEIAEMTRDAFAAVESHPGQDPLRIGHHLAALVADLGRAIDAEDTGSEAVQFVEHARALFATIPDDRGTNLVEVDLSDREQLARLLQATEEAQAHSSESPYALGIRSEEFHHQLAQFTALAESLLEQNEQPEVSEGLIDSLVNLQSMAAASSIEHVGRVVACALRVVEAHRAAEQSLPLDAVEFIIACRRIIPMILDSLDEPERVSHAVDALVDQSAFVLLELRRGSQPSEELWPEPAPEEYLELSGCDYKGPSPERADDERIGLEDDQEEFESSPAAQEIHGNVEKAFEHTQVPAAADEVIAVPAEGLVEVMQLVGELAVRSGGYSQRSRKVLSVSQDVNSIGDRLRYLIRGWQQGKYTQDQVVNHLSEITADLNLAASDLEHARHDHMAASERQAELRKRLERALTQIRTVPVQSISASLRDVVHAAAERSGRTVDLVVQVGSTVVHAQHAEALTKALQELVLNAIEHGIESPQERKANDKPTAGTIRIRASRDGSQTVIQVADDGAGIDETRILAIAKEAGYPTSNRGTTRDRALQYIFLPGFSTRSVQDGREAGQGLDIVNEALFQASGSVTVRSEAGSGTVFTLRLPAASMTLPAQIVSVSSERYAIPAASIEIVDRVQITDVSAHGEGYRAKIGETAMPAADLGALLGIRSQHHIENEHGAFMLVEYESERWLVRVDNVLDEQVIVLDTLAREQHHVNGAVASTSLASGDTAVVLDICQVLDAGSRRSRRFSRQTGTLARVPFALVSDDSISVRRQLAGALETQGWRVVEARDAFESRELLETIVPDLVVVDLDLPAHGGFQITQAARRLGDMPVIGLTAHQNPEIRRRAESFEIDAFLHKPLDLERFAGTLQRVLHQE